MRRSFIPWIAAALVCIGALSAPLSAQCNSWDTWFGVNGLGKPAYLPKAEAMAVFDDGSGPALYIGGDFDAAGNEPAHGLARWNGSTWSALPLAFSRVHALTVFDDGSGPALYIAGTVQVIDGTPSAQVTRWDGTTFTPLATTNSGGEVYALAAYDDGNGPKLYAGGSFGTLNGVPVGQIARWDGSSWSPVGTGVSGLVTELLVHDDGSGPALYVGGDFLSPSRCIARWNGSTWSSLGSGVTSFEPYVGALKSFDDGSGTALYIGGRFTSVSGVAAAGVARWNGSSWSAVGAGFSGWVFCFDVFSDGGGPPQLYAGGAPGFSASTLINGVARWNGTAWTNLNNGATGDNGTVQAMRVFDDGAGPTLFVGGDFRDADGMLANSIARWKSSSWSLLPATPSGRGVERGTPRAFAAFDDGSGPALFVAGVGRAGGVTAAGTAKWNGTSWIDIGSGLTSGTAFGVHDAGSGPELYLTGQGINDAYTTTRWNGVTWQPLGTGMSGTGVALCSGDDGTGPALFVGGIFTTAGGQPVHDIARWDGVSWSTLGSGVGGGHISGLAFYDDGTGSALYATGTFTTAGGQPASRIARWNGSTWAAIGSGLNQAGACLHVFDDGSGPALYVGGSFTTAGGVATSGIARWNGAWSAVGTGLTGRVTAFTTFHDGTGTGLIASGTLSVSGGASAARLVRWNGSTWQTVSGDTFQYTFEGAPKCLAVYRAPGTAEPVLYAGGSFVSVGATASLGIAAWHGCPGPGGSFCLGDGSGTACPCGNTSLTADAAGCLNSLGSGGKLSSSGFANLSQDTLRLEGEGMPNAAALYFQGTARVGGGAGVTFGDGLRCAGGSVVRLRTVLNSGGASTFPNVLDPTPIHVKGAVTAPAVRTYQVWYRNAALFCTPSTFNLTNGLEVTWAN